MAFYAIDRIGAVANWVDMKVSPAEVEEHSPRQVPRWPWCWRWPFQGLPSPGKGPYPALRGAAPGSPTWPRNWRESSISTPGSRGQVRTACPGRTFSELLPKCRRRQTGGKSRWPSPTPGHHGAYQRCGALPAVLCLGAGVLYLSRDGVWQRGFALVLLPLFAVFGLSQCLHTLPLWGWG